MANGFDDVADQLHTLASQAVRKVAFDLQANAASKAPVDTGFLRSSIYVVTSDDSTYGQASSAPEGASLLPQVDAPDDDLTAYVGVGASYAVYQELGTVHSPAQPFLTPAAEQAKQTLDAVMDAIAQKLGQ